MQLESFLKMIREVKCLNGKLTIRDIYDFRVEDKHLSEILEALKNSNGVREIFLESNLTANGVHELAKFLEDNNEIESVSLWNQDRYHYPQNDTIGCFVPVIQKNKTLKRLVLTGIGAEKADTTQFFEALKVNNQIEHLSLYNNRFESCEMANQIATLISSNTVLKTLNLNGHYFKENELKIIADSLASNKTLEEIDVDGFRVGNEGASIFATELAKDINLKAIRFFDSTITAPGAIALANSLVTNTHLTTLDLGCDSIGLEGTLALAKALETNRKLQVLKIGVYSANDEGVKAFADMLEKNTSLIEFDYNPFYTKGNGMDKLRIDMSLTRNKIAFLEHQTGQAAIEQRQEAVEKLKELEAQYQQKITPPNFSEYVDMRIAATRAGRWGCCAFPFFAGSVAASSSNEEDCSENKTSSP